MKVNQPLQEGSSVGARKPSFCLLRQGHGPQSGLSQGRADGPDFDFPLGQPNHACLPALLELLHWSLGLTV